jgi:hypothetical protein
MTDNDDPVSPRRIFSSLTRDEREDQSETKLPPRAHVVRPTRPRSGSSQVAPTDPEVPTAKRRGALRRRRSLVGLTALVVGLLSITVSLLYRASLRVGSPRMQSEGAPYRSTNPPTDALVPPRATSSASTMTGLRAPAPMPYRGELDEDDESARDDDRPSVDSAASPSAESQPKGPPPAMDIIRTPAF